MSNKTGKYVKSTIFVLLLLMGAFFIVAPSSVEAASDGDYTYELGGIPLAATITKYTGSGGAISIPSNLGGYSTIAIGPEAFSGCTYITSVFIPNGINLIGNNAFRSCTSMVYLTIPDSVVTIGDRAFFQCTALTSIALGSGIEVIGYGAFQSCTSLTSASIMGSGVTSIGEYSFFDCGSLVSVILGNGISSIGDFAFGTDRPTQQGVLYSLQLVTILGNGETSIGRYAFSGCYALTSVTLGNGVASIGEWSFAYCTSLTSFSIPDSVTMIGSYAFAGAYRLTSISFTGQVAMTMMGGNWVDPSSSSRGHAYATSNFPAPGESFYGLIMGTYIPTVPDAPTSLSATPSNAQVGLTWTAPEDNGGRIITSYNVYRTTSETAIPVLIASPTGTSYVDTNLVNGQTYWYRVSAVNTVGEGVLTAAASATPAPIVPMAPQNPAAAMSVGRITLTWQAPASDGGSSITGYKVYRYLAGTAVLLANVSSSTLNYADTTGTLGTTYSYWIAAANSIGIGAVSTTVSATTAALPGSPTGLTIIPGNAQVSLNWTAPTFSGGIALSNYRLYRSSTEMGTYVLIDSPTGTTFLDSGRTNGETYWYCVSAVNAVGESARTAPISSMPRTVPDTPNGLNAVIGNTQVVLNWTVPAFNGGVPIDYYIIYRNGVDLSHPTETTATITGLTNGQEYSFTVAAHNLVGVGTQSGAVSSIPYTTSGAPLGLIATPGNSQVSISWTVPAFNGGRAIDHYVVFQDGFALDVHPTTLTAVINGLTSGQEYRFTVAAHNIAGLSIQSSAASTTPYAAPGAPSGLLISSGNAQASLSWTAPASNGGRSIDYYVIYQDGVALPGHSTTTTISITGLTNWQVYSFTIAAHNVAGIGTQCFSATAAPTALPGVPIGLTATPSIGKVTINWQAPSSTGGSPITGYVVYRGGQVLANLGASASEYVDASGTAGTSNIYYVAAKNVAGEGSLSVPASATPQSPADLTMFYAGIAFAVIAVIVVAVVLMRKKK